MSKEKPPKHLAHTSMRLILSTPDPRNSTYTTNAGQILYKVKESSGRLKSEIATIQKASVNSVHGGVWQWRGGSEPTWLGPISFPTPVFADPGCPDINGIPSTTNDFYPEPTTWPRYGDGNVLHGYDQRRPITFPTPTTFADTNTDDFSKRKGAPKSEGHFTFCAEIKFHIISPTWFRYNGLDIPVDEYFRKKGWSWYGR